jgi:hypothetical protein
VGVAALLVGGAVASAAGKAPDAVRLVT